VYEIVMAGLQIRYTRLDLSLPPGGHRYISALNLKFHETSPSSLCRQRLLLPVFYS
jgi:hypothetical protein